ncbi:DUF397 domain-containing protein [Streptomyces chrestomyceticus]|uniref:DUF397 domain-containing protein n=1 Tax=Streptomyces chrestomyceticus TaxID=68185 RepID=UPI0037A532E8
MTKHHDLTGARYQKSTYSSQQGGSCVEVARNLPGIVPVRDSKDPEGPSVVFSPAAWTTFLKQL